MKRYITLALGMLLVVGAVVSLPGCGHDQVLTSITVNPSGATITGAGVIVNFQAIGTYIHPPENKDLTNSVVWASVAPQIIDFNFVGSTAGQAMSGSGCGSNIGITATHYSDPQNKSGSVVVGNAVVTVKGNPGC